MHSDIIYVPDMGQIGAGTVVPFTPKHKKIPIPRPPNTTDADFIFTHDVSGDSLYNPDNPSMSAYNGDRLICKGNFEPTEVKPHKVCIVFIQTTCERLAKKVDIKNGQVYLRGLKFTHLSEPSNLSTTRGNLLTGKGLRQWSRLK